jgi:Fe2+ or Zn2+ uptake regulation protein
LKQIATEQNFRVAGHTLVVSGLCAACNAARAGRRLNF